MLEYMCIFKGKDRNPFPEYKQKLSSREHFRIYSTQSWCQQKSLTTLCVRAMAWWLTPRTPDPEVGGSSPTRVAVLCPTARYIYPQNVLVIPRKRWLRPNMTEKLFTGTLSIKPNQKLCAFVRSFKIVPLL